MIVLPLHGTSRVLLCEGTGCLDTDIVTGARIPFGTLPAPIVGGGGWADFAIIVDQKGNSLVRIGDAIHEGPAIECFAVCDVAIASVARRFAIAFDTDSWYSNGQVRLYDVADDGSLTSQTFQFDSRDCLLMDACALSPDGAYLGAAALDIVFTSVGDWSYGQYQKAFVVDIVRNKTVIDIVVEETSRPSERRRTPIALGRHVWFCDNVPLVADANRDEVLQCLATEVADDGALVALTADRLSIFLDDQLVAEHRMTASSFAIIGDQIVVACGNQLNLIAR